MARGYLTSPGASSAYGGNAYAASCGCIPGWTVTQSMLVARAFFYQNGEGAVPLEDGALITGGYDVGTDTVFASATKYTTAEGTWSEQPAMASQRYNHTATKLPDGRVLVAGGAFYDFTELLDSCELRDPATGVWSPAASMAIPRRLHTATLLADGRVLVTGGYTLVGGVPTPTATAEVYDPELNTWTTTVGPMAGPRYDHTAVRLQSGLVLIAGGSEDAALPVLATAELFDPSAGTFAATGSMVVGRSAAPSALLLSDGRVLITGGSTGAVPLASCELYSPGAGTFAATAGPLATARAFHTATMLENDVVLVAGGLGPGGAALASAELFDPINTTFSSGGSMSAPRYQHVAVSLSPTVVLLAGGSDDDGTDDVAITDVYTVRCP